MGVFYIGIAAFTPVPPTANAGPDQTFNLPTTTATLTGSGSSTDGTIVSYAWTQVSGPGSSITSPSSATTGITGMTTAGTYVYQLEVTDNYSLTGTDTITIIVAALANVVVTMSMAEGSTNFTIAASTIGEPTVSCDLVITFATQYDEGGTHTGPSGTLTLLAGTNYASGGFGSHSPGSTTGMIFTSLSVSPTTCDGRSISVTS